MAKSYLGKISALVTANTSDFNRKLDESAQRTRSFAASVKSQINAAERAASKSLDGIYTSLQKVERALSAAGGRRLSLIDDREANKIRQLVSAAEEVYRPLERAAKASEKLGADVRANFQPALIAAQKSAESLNRVIESGGTVGERSFQRIRRQVELTAESIDRLSEVQAEVGRLATGRELRFSRPSVAAALEDARASQQRLDARGASGAARVGRMGSGEIVQRQIEAANQIEAAYSRLLAARSEQASNRFRSPGNVAAAEDALDDRVAALNRVTAELNAQQDILDQQVAREEELAAAERRRADAAREFASFQDRVKQAVSGTPQTIGQAQQQFEKLAATIGKLNPAGQGAVQPLVDELLGLFSAASAGDDVLSNVIVKLNQLRDAADSAALLGNPSGPFGPPEPPGVGVFPTFPGNANGEATVALPPGFGGSSSAGLGAEIGDPTRQLDSFRAQIVAIKAQVDSLPESIRGRFIPDVQALEAAFRAASAAPEEFAGSLSVINGEIQKTSKSIDLAARANKAFGNTVADAFEASQVRSYQAQLVILQGLLLNAGITTGEAVETVDKLGLQLKEAATESGGLRASAEAIASSFGEAASQVAAVTNTSRKSVDERLKRAGDIGRFGADRFSLAIQQAAFAVDDFFSVTGGLDQRIRAVGNNLSQLGFLVGGTKGLIAGIAVSIGSQLVVSLINWYQAGAKTEDQTKSLNDSLSKQKNLVDELAQAFRALGDSISSGVFSTQARAARDFSRQLDELREKQRESREAVLADLDPAVQRQRAEIQRIDREVAESNDPAQRVALLRERRDAVRREQAAVRAAVSRPAPSRAEVERTLVGTVRPNEFLVGGNLTAESNRRAEERRQELRDKVEAAQGDSEALIAAAEARLAERQKVASQSIGISNFLGGDAPEIYRAREDVANLNRLIESLRAGSNKELDKIAIDAVESTRLPAVQIEQAQELIQRALDAGVASAAGTRSRADQLGQELDDAFTKLEDAAKEADPEKRRELIKEAQKEIDTVREKVIAIDEEVKAIDAARRSIEAFGVVIERVRQAANQTVSAAESNLSNAERDFEIRPSLTTVRALAQAQNEFNAAQNQRAAVEAEAAQAEERARNDPESQRRQRRIAEIDQELSTTGVLAPGQREALIAERERLREEERRRIDPILEQARRDEQEFSARQESARRGREIGQTPAERAGQDLARNLVDLQNAFDTTIGPQVQGDLVADQQRVINEALRSTAPAIFGLADQVQNAVLQGPSRAALQASDVTTAQGAAELNRLLRGDDSARNQDLVELQKQSNSLEELVRIARESGAPPGVLDL